MKNKQTGASLLLTLIVLTAMLFTTLALMRSTSTAGMVAGNLAFKDAAMHEADIGFNQAIKAIKPCAATPVQPCGKATDVTYVSQTQLAESYFLVSDNWNNAPAQAATAPTAIGVPNYTVKYIVDRLSTGLINTQDSTDVEKHSMGIIAKDSSPSYDYSELGTPNTLLSVPAVFYRITVRVTGANNTDYTAQTTVTVASS